MLQNRGVNGIFSCREEYLREKKRLLQKRLIMRWVSFTSAVLCVFTVLWMAIGGPKLMDDIKEFNEASHEALIELKEREKELSDTEHIYDALEYAKKEADSAELEALQEVAENVSENEDELPMPSGVKLERHGCGTIDDIVWDSDRVVKVSTHYALSFPESKFREAMVENPFHEMDIPLSLEMQKYVHEVSAFHGFDYELLLAIIQTESNFNETIISRDGGDYGFMQINKANHKTFRNMGLTNMLDGKQNIAAGAYILDSNLSKYKTPHKALMAYNFGPGGAAKHWKKGTYTSEYSRKVMSIYEDMLAGKYDK